MDILELVQIVIRESATAALAVFAIWSVKQLYEERLREREDYSDRLEKVNTLLVTKLEEGTQAIATSTEVVRQNTQTLERTIAVIEKLLAN